MNIVDEYLQRYLRLVRVADGESIENVKRIEKANEKIIGMFEKVFAKKRITKLDLSALRVNIHNIISFVYNKDLIVKLSKDVDDLIQLEFDWHKGTFKKLGFGQKILTSDQQLVVNDALKKPYQGRTFKDWFEGEGALHYDKIRKIINAGVVSGSSTDKITRAIADVSKLPIHHVRTLTRSAIMSAMNDVKSVFFDDNQDLIDGKMWLSTLDVRTTPFICGPRDGLKYTVDNDPIGHNLPWSEGPGRIHFNCRSTWVPLIDGFSITAPRSAIEPGENYEKGDKTTRTGKVRKPTQSSRDQGILKIEQYTNRTKYEGWLRRQPTDYVADAFDGNIEIARKFKNGQTLQELNQSIHGSPLNVSTL